VCAHRKFEKCTEDSFNLVFRARGLVRKVLADSAKDLGLLRYLANVGEPGGITAVPGTERTINGSAASHVAIICWRRNE
jgi:hypothetical protein